MAEEWNTPFTQAQIGEFNAKLNAAATEQVVDVFANVSLVSIAQSDVTLFFGRQLEEMSGNIEIRGRCRITLSHDNFIKMVGYWSGYAALLATTYGEDTPSLASVQARHPERWQKAIEQFQGLTSQGDENGSSGKAE